MPNYLFLKKTFLNVESTSLGGQKILVPHVVAENQAENIALKKKQLQNYQANVYIVKKGDTLYEIAKRHGTTVNQIKSWNDSDDNLSIGQKLMIVKS